MTAVRERLWDWLVEPNYEGSSFDDNEPIFQAVLQDPRTKDWPLLDLASPLAISAGYLGGIAVGVRLMRDRAPLRLRSSIALHNSVLFLLSLYMCIETLRQSYIEFEWGKGGNIFCPAIRDGPFSPAAKRLASVLWIHYLSKAYEFVDTFIMVLKKSTRQITFLHVYHHATTFFPVWWSVMKYGPGGAAYFCCALNSFIHVWMYGYYLLAGLGVKWTAVKPFITYSQMIQFLCFITQASYMLVTDCYRPRLTVVFLLFQCIVFFVLFSNFAYHTYWRPKQKAV